MVLNPDKCHFMTLGFTNPLPDVSYKDVIIKNTTQERVLGITIDSKLNFKKAHLRNTKRSLQNL